MSEQNPELEVPPINRIAQYRHAVALSIQKDTKRNNGADNTLLILLESVFLDEDKLKIA